MTAYSKGTYFERRCKKHLEEMGADVTRSAGSHSNRDLTAFWLNNLRPWWVQCKVNGHMTKLEKAAFAEAAHARGAEAVLMSKDARGKIKVERL